MSDLETMVDEARLCTCGHPKGKHTFKGGQCSILECECGLFQQKVITATIHFEQEELVNHPAHYGGGDNPYEHIKVCDAWGLNYRLGNATKYICRAGKKSPNAIEDLKKALWYIQSEIERLENEHEQFG